MSELMLSDDLKIIELEINHHKNIAGQSIWEIGRRLNHVKDNDLAHGEFMEWVKSIGMEYKEAQRFMKVANELPEWTTLSNLIIALPSNYQNTLMDWGSNNASYMWLKCINTPTFIMTWLNRRRKQRWLILSGSSNF